MTQLEALQNAATYTGMPGLVVYEKIFEDKRKTTKHYFLNIGRETISPVLDYENMNHFILGFSQGIKRTPANLDATEKELLIRSLMYTQIGMRMNIKAATTKAHVNEYECEEVFAKALETKLRGLWHGKGILPR